MMSSEFENILQNNSQQIGNICRQLTGTFSDIYKKMETEKKLFKKELKAIEDRMNNQITRLLEILLEKEKEIKRLQDELKENTFDESNYTKVSFIRQQDKLISELKTRIELVEKQNKMLKNKVNENNIAESNTVVESVVESVVEANNVEESVVEANNVEEITEEPIPQQPVEDKKKRKPRKKKEVLEDDKGEKPKRRGRKKKVEEPKTEPKTESRVEPKTESRVEPTEDNPSLENMDVEEYDGREFYRSTITNFIYEYANDDGDIGNRVGYFENNKINFY